VPIDSRLPPFEFFYRSILRSGLSISIFAILLVVFSGLGYVLIATRLGPSNWSTSAPIADPNVLVLRIAQVIFLALVLLVGFVSMAYSMEARRLRRSLRSDQNRYEGGDALRNFVLSAVASRIASGETVSLGSVATDLGLPLEIVRQEVSTLLARKFGYLPGGPHIPNNL
jgi:hypothetical protein